MGGLVGITGTPGTGKKTIAPLVASALGLKCISINEIAVNRGLLDKFPGAGEVDTQQLKRILAYTLRGPSLVYGHLLPYVLSRRSLECVAVLRCEPSVLKERLIARGYAEAKVIGNVEAELIGLVASDAYRVFGKEKTFEVDTTYTSPMKAADVALNAIRGKAPHQLRVDWITNYDSAQKLRLLLSQS